MSSKFARDRSLRGAKEIHDQLQHSLQETPTEGKWNVTRIFRPPENVRFYGIWLKWACKLLDLAYLRQYWAHLGLYLGEVSKRIESFKKRPKGIKKSP